MKKKTTDLQNKPNISQIIRLMLQHPNLEASEAKAPKVLADDPPPYPFRNKDKISWYRQVRTLHPANGGRASWSAETIRVPRPANAEQVLKLLGFK